MLPVKAEKGIMQMVLDKNSNRELVRAFSAVPMSVVLKAQYPSVRVLSKQYGSQKVEGVMSVIIKEASNYFGEGLKDDICKDISAEIYALYPYFSLEEIFKVLAELKQKEIFGKLTANKVLSAFAKHLERRCDFWEKVNMNKHLRTKESRENYSDVTKELFRKAFKKHFINNLKSKKDEK